jgi:hypothetical protein
MAYVFTRTNSGANVKWKNISGLSTYATLTNNSGISPTDVYSIINSSLAEWSSANSLDLRVYSTTNRAQPSRNDIYFSTESLYFNDTGILAVTQVSYGEATGDIVEADIIINDSVVFSSNPLDKKYLGNVLTHEIGHMLGLGHSQVEDASMLFVLAKGEHTISNDDKAGTRVVFSRSGFGKIQGVVIGGPQRIGVFGSHVEAISEQTGLTMGAALSEVDGGFEIAGLPLGDTYYLYIKPASALESLPEYYSTIQTNFCNSGKNYRGSFFTQCGIAEQGLPFGIILTSAVPSYHVGYLTIRCGLDAPDSYMDTKDTINSYVPNVIKPNNKFGEVFSGFFSNYDLSGEVPDYIELDLSSYTIPANTYLDLKLLSQLFYSQVKLSLEVQNLQTMGVTSFPLTSELTAEGLLLDTDGNPNLDINGRLLLTAGQSVNNRFKIKITPQVVGTFILGKSISDLSSYFQGYSSFKDNAAFYLFIVSLSQPQIDGSYKAYQFKEYQPGLGNLQCPDAPNTYAVKSVVPTATVKPKKLSSTDKFPLACGTVDMSGPSGPSNFLGSFSLSFLLVIMVDFFRRPKKLEFPRL